MRDPYAGHRGDDQWWVPDPMRDTQWTDWDYILLDAAMTIEMLENTQSGQLANLAEDPDVFWEVDSRMDYAMQTLERHQKEHEAEPGERFFVKNPQKREGKPFWTVSEWLESLESGDQPKDREAPQGARPPTAEELAEMRARRMRAIQDADDASIN